MDPTQAATIGAGKTERGVSVSQTLKLSSTYISPRLAARLEEAEQCQMTTTVAPMGYGKAATMRG